MTVTPGQRRVLKLMDEGWELRYLEAGARVGWFAVLADRSQDIHANTARGMFSKGLIERDESLSNVVTSWKLTGKGRESLE